MISFTEAVEKATDYIKNMDTPVVITLQGRFAEGWFFCFQSREYLETGEFSAQLAGNAPFIIDKDTGEIHELGTAYPIEKYLQDYEEKKNVLS
ncbi:YrhB domain-containing protein [Serratia microhaemolytica]|uniref:YrhB domain-containing protein n=1 Tax=Serratia microhaemolytica TaxID=2675110 RepID=UPI000FDE71EE|nr:YrhB domain-containing protein [Serratia microhaemolytica]